MSLDLRELYQEIIVDHNKNPRNFLVLENPTQIAQGYNPLCGDKLTVYLIVREGIIDAVSFVGDGCAISKASASLMTEAITGKSVTEAEALFHDFHTMATSDEEPAPSLKKLAVLAGVRQFPARVKCATLAWHTLDAALKKNPDTVVTE